MTFNCNHQPMKYVVIWKCLYMCLKKIDYLNQFKTDDQNVFRLVYIYCVQAVDKTRPFSYLPYNLFYIPLDMRFQIGQLSFIFKIMCLRYSQVTMVSPSFSWRGNSGCFHKKKINPKTNNLQQELNVRNTEMFMAQEHVFFYENFEKFPK